ncbi:zinc finger protein 79 [Aedes albopictus]|uniref:C2h2-type zn-finger protein n=1 Tax=Aedes albopictus TaxID=7160 RepID=A0ABM1ZVZ2_AEDAL|nr:zinc finger protein 79-like [Aedes albopictus]KXJ73418.1 hypothetical protein RP20_CCG015899 [Aedes albopictus]
MSVSRIKALVENYTKVCRFCLTMNPTAELAPLFDRIVGKTDIITINATVRGVLTTLGIQIAQNDAYPNRICGNCRDLLHSVQHFQETTRKSIQLLDQARLLKEFPNARFDDDADPVSMVVKEDYQIEEPVLEVAYEELVVSQKEECETVVEDVKPPDLEQREEPSMPVEESEAKPDPEYTDMEWVMLDDGGETESHQEDIYVDEEYIVEDEEEQTSEIPMAPAIPPEKSEEEEASAEESMKEPYVKSPRMCPICGATSTAMKVHMRTHTQVRPFKCEQCERKFYTNAKLRSHVESVHIGERKYSCEICGKAFVLRKTLNAHILSHATEKDYICSICSKGFLFRWALVKHERVHTGEKPYLCDLDGCGKRFATSSNLKQHQKTNTHCKNPREDVCEHCNKTFQSKYALRVHLKTHEVKAGATSEAKG